VANLAGVWRAGGRVEWRDRAPVLAMSDSLAAIAAMRGRRSVALGYGFGGEHGADPSALVVLGYGLGGEHGADPSAAGSRSVALGHGFGGGARGRPLGRGQPGHKAMAKAKGLQGGEK
jgi:hypothetical protein